MPRVTCPECYGEGSIVHAAIVDDDAWQTICAVCNGACTIPEEAAHALAVAGYAVALAWEQVTADRGADRDGWRAIAAERGMSVVQFVSLRVEERAREIAAELEARPREEQARLIAERDARILAEAQAMLPEGPEVTCPLPLGETDGTAF